MADMDSGIPGGDFNLVKAFAAVSMDNGSHGAASTPTKPKLAVASYHSESHVS
jgi:hypothetical protein